MSNRLARFGNDLHSGRTSYPFVGKHKLWLSLALGLVLLSMLIPVLKGGFNLGIDFTGGCATAANLILGRIGRWVGCLGCGNGSRGS